MYATWIDYGIVTNMGAKAGVLIYNLPKWDDGSVALGYGLLSSPSKSIKIYSTCTIRDSGLILNAINTRTFGARPALY